MRSVYFTAKLNDFVVRVHSWGNFALLFVFFVFLKRCKPFGWEEILVLCLFGLGKGLIVLCTMTGKGGTSCIRSSVTTCPTKRGDDYLVFIFPSKPALSDFQFWSITDQYSLTVRTGLVSAFVDAGVHSSLAGPPHPDEARWNAHTHLSPKSLLALPPNHVHTHRRDGRGVHSLCTTRYFTSSTPWS